jgi:Circularly permutated YpsA SLOG family
MTRKILFQKIISGGQTGVDQAALDVAINLGITCGGWCPPGRTCENGRIPSAYHLKETPAEKSDAAPGVNRSLRTEWNVRDADALLVLLPNNLKTDEGSEWTIQCAVNCGKPILIMDPFAAKASTQIKRWLESISIRVLNIAGPSETSCPGIGEQTKKLLLATFA